MADGVLYQYRQQNSDILNIRAFSASEGRSVELSKIAEQAKREAEELRHSAIQEKQNEIERKLLVHLAELDDDSDYDKEFLKPSKVATTTTRNTLLQAYRGIFNFTYLPKFITADGEGGIRIQWQNKEREIRLLCSAEGLLKLYWQDGKKYDLEEPTIKNLTARFYWLNLA